jgi:hypothetical protein
MRCKSALINVINALKPAMNVAMHAKIQIKNVLIYAKSAFRLVMNA